MKAPMVEKNVFLAPSADVMGDVILEENSSVWYQAVVRGDCTSIRIGKGSNIQDGSVVHADPGYPVEIGEGVTIGHGAIIHGCSIGDNSLVGMGAIVLNGASIGKNCIVSAGALVTGGTQIPDGMMALGSPARAVRPVREEEILSNRENAEEYMHLAMEHMKG